LTGCPAPCRNLPQHPSAAAIPARDTDTDARGFYHQPAGLADDFPEESTTPEKIRHDLEVARETGARYFRFAIGWDGVETTPGHYEWGFWDELVRLAGDYGIVLLPYVCYTPAWANPHPTDYWRQPPTDLKRFGAFMGVIAGRYRGQIASWELWNEPDIENYWTGTPAEFAEMVREGARQVRRADPDAVIVLGGMARGRSPFLEALLREHDLGKEFDVVNIHGYFETWDPAPAEEYPQKLQSVRDLLAETAPHLDLWLAEFGYSDYRLDCDSASEWVDIRYRYEHTEEYQAVALWKHHVLAAASEDVSLTTWYRIHDLPEAEGVIGDDNNKHLGILNVFGDPKPAYYSLRFFNRLFDHPFRGVPVAVERPAGSRSQVHVFEENDGSWIVTAWLPTGDTSGAVGPPGWGKDAREEKISVRLPLPGPARWRSYRVNGRPEGSGRLSADGILEGIRLTGGSVYIAEIVPEEIGR
jgi:hypothetical protein